VHETIFHKIAPANDIERAGRLLAEFVTRLDEDFLSGLVDDLVDKKD